MKRRAYEDASNTVLAGVKSAAVVADDLPRCAVLGDRGFHRPPCRGVLTDNYAGREWCRREVLLAEVTDPVKTSVGLLFIGFLGRRKTRHHAGCLDPMDRRCPLVPPGFGPDACTIPLTGSGR